MRYKEFRPDSFLKDYVQCYFVCETDTAVFTEDIVFATGFIEIMFNLGADGPQQIKNGNLISQPDIQLWGQTIHPFTFASFGKHSMLGIRFFAHTAACFFNEPIEEFNDQVIDFKDICGRDAVLLHSKLLEGQSLDRRIELVEEFLLQRLLRFANKFNRLKLVNSVMHDLSRDDFFENINSIASRYGISSRYLQTIFLNYAGITPNLFSKITRFQNSLYLVSDKNLSLTTIAHKCGYFDQSHFIKDFKFFTGSAPSRFSPESSTDLIAALQN
ncbi:MAG: helix-turn-helix transcriptional regulator [Bacteroidota bacterium]|nr:helix-turn-helix transcriptional regulator [Bacteroidota bacterium]